MANLVQRRGSILARCFLFLLLARRDQVFLVKNLADNVSGNNQSNSKVDGFFLTPGSNNHIISVFRVYFPVVLSQAEEMA
jgi:hypothetical protein